MWSNNTGDSAIEVFKILNGHENVDPNIFVNITTGKRTRGHDFMLVKGQRMFDVRKYSFSPEFRI